MIARVPLAEINGNGERRVSSAADKYSRKRVAFPSAHSVISQSRPRVLTSLSKPERTQLGSFAVQPGREIYQTAERLLIYFSCAPDAMEYEETVISGVSDGSKQL